MHRISHTDEFSFAKRGNEHYACYLCLDVAPRRLCSVGAHRWGSQLPELFLLLVEMRQIPEISGGMLSPECFSTCNALRGQLLEISEVQRARKLWGCYSWFPRPPQTRQMCTWWEGMVRARASLSSLTMQDVLPPEMPQTRPEDCDQNISGRKRCKGITSLLRSLTALSFTSHHRGAYFDPGWIPDVFFRVKGWFNSW